MIYGSARIMIRAARAIMIALGNPRMRGLQPEYCQPNMFGWPGWRMRQPAAPLMSGADPKLSGGGGIRTLEGLRQPQPA